MLVTFVLRSKYVLKVNGKHHINYNEKKSTIRTIQVKYCYDRYFKCRIRHYQLFGP